MKLRYIPIFFWPPQIASIASAPPPFAWTSAAETAWRKGSVPPRKMWNLTMDDTIAGWWFQPL